MASATGHDIRAHNRNGCSMLDLAFIAVGLGFFGLAAGYAVLCERL